MIGLESLWKGAVFLFRVEACYIPFCLCFQQAFRLRKDLINFSGGRRVEYRALHTNGTILSVGVRMFLLLQLVARGNSNHVRL